MIRRTPSLSANTPYLALHLALSCLLAGGAMAQGAPGAGRLLQEETARVRPEAPIRPVLPTLAAPAPPAAASLPVAADEARVELKGLRFRGNNAIDTPRLQDLLADLLGRPIGLAELQAAAGQITALYLREDFPLARAYLAPQDIVDGVVEFAIVEGSVGRIQLDNRSRLDDAQLRAFLAPLREGAPLRGMALERSLLLLNQLAGIEARGTLAPGAAPGSTDLLVQINEARRTPASAGLDNQGNRYSGTWRLSAQATLDNPMALGDALRLRASTAGAPLRHARLAYQRPLGAEGWQAGLAWSELGYRLTRDFAVLDASGTAGGLSAYAQYPLLRSRQINLKLSLTAEHRRLVDRVGQAALRSEKLVDLIGLGLSGDTQAGLLDSWSLTLSGGRLELDPDSAALDALGARSAGRFARVNWNASKAWWLPSPAETWSIAAQVSGQRVLGGRNLDSSEKLGLGGPQAVRAYAQGESPSDDALLLNLELRWRPADSWLLSAFLDGASGRLNHVPTTAPPGGNSRQLSGYGLGAASSIGKTLNWMASLAWRSGDAPRNAADRSVQLWTSVQGIF